MYNSTFRIYCITQIEDVILGRHIDPTFTIFVDEPDETGILKINYPYFKKPEYKIIDPFEDSEQDNP